MIEIYFRPAFAGSPWPPVYTTERVLPVN